MALLVLLLSGIIRKGSEFCVCPAYVTDLSVATICGDYKMIYALLWGWPKL